MKLPISTRSRGASRGQALVEMAIMLPILILLLLLAVDMGRVFFGWIAINNATRIGANEAAKNPTPWSQGLPDDLFYERMAHDLESIDCSIPDYDADGRTSDTNGYAELLQDLKAAPTPVVQPQFINNADDPNDPYEVGDEVTVNIDCNFGFLTPLVGNIVGDPLKISATSTFMVFGGEIAGIPVPPDPVPAGCIGTDAEVPNLVGSTLVDARNLWTAAGFTGTFNPASGTDTDIVLTQTTSPSSSAGDCLIYTANVTVTHKDPTCGPTEAPVPNLVSLTVASARSLWSSSGFSGGFTPLTGSDSDIVTGQATNPVKAVGECAPLTTQVNVSHTTSSGGTCTMVQVLGYTIAQAQGAYTTQGFTGSFSYNPTNKPTWVVKNQNLIGGQTYACTASLQVQLEKP
jgi:hypothetical protein